LPEMHSSSDMSTPMVLPRKGEGEMDNGNGNVLTLREQEAVSRRRIHALTCIRTANRSTAP
jgi:hypothetical protein